MPYGRTDWLWKIDLLSSLSSKSGALVTQQQMSVMSVSLQMSTFLSNKINEKITISLLKSDFRGYFICMFKIVSNQKELPNSICNPWIHNRSEDFACILKGNCQKADKFWDKVSYLCLSTNDKSAAHIVSEQELKRSVVPVFVSPPYLERQLMSVGEGGSLEETWCPQFSKFENICINCGHANFHLQPLVWCPICLERVNWDFFEMASSTKTLMSTFHEAF